MWASGCNLAVAEAELLGCEHELSIDSGKAVLTSFGNEFFLLDDLLELVEEPWVDPCVAVDLLGGHACQQSGADPVRSIGQGRCQMCPDLFWIDLLGGFVRLARDVAEAVQSDFESAHGLL